jgi:hypothetical protein
LKDYYFLALKLYRILQKNAKMKKVLTFLFFTLFIAGVNAQIANQPSDLMACDGNFMAPDDGWAIFDLTITVPEILGTQDPSLFVVAFFESELDLMNNIPIANPASYVSFVSPNQIFAQLYDSSGNTDSTSFSLFVLQTPIPETPTPLEVCDDDGDGFAAFDLSLKDDEIANGDPDVSITYFETEIDALNGVLSIPSPYINIIPFSQTVFARTDNILTGCYAIVMLELWVLDGCPIITTPPTNLFINEGDDNGLAIFDLTVNEPQMLGSQDPNLYRFSYHENFQDSEVNANEIIAKTVYQNIANPQTIYVRLTNNANGSYVLSNFEIETDGVLGINSNGFSDLSIFPIPASERISIQSQYLTSESDITIFTIHGQQVFSGRITPEEGKIDVDISKISPGIYLLKLVSEGNTITRKLIKN